MLADSFLDVAVLELCVTVKFGAQNSPQGRQFPRQEAAFPSVSMSGKRSFFASKKKATNPFDSDSDDGDKKQQRPARASSVPPPAQQRVALFGAGAGGQERGGLLSSLEAPRNSHYRNDFRDAGGLESQSVQELEGYAAYKAEETTDALAGCLRIAEDIKQDATDTLITLHKQGEQISRTHEKAVEIDQDLTKVSACVLTMASGVCEQLPAAHAVSLIVSSSFFARS